MLEFRWVNDDGLLTLQFRTRLRENMPSGARIAARNVQSLLRETGGVDDRD